MGSNLIAETCGTFNSCSRAKLIRQNVVNALSIAFLVHVFQIVGPILLYQKFSRPYNFTFLFVNVAFRNSFQF